MNDNILPIILIFFATLSITFQIHAWYFPKCYDEDSCRYTNQWSGAQKPPFKYRILTPYLSNLISNNYVIGFFITNFTGYFTTFMTFYFFLQKLSYNKKTALTGTLITMLNLYTTNFAWRWLVDGIFLATFTICLYALLTKNFPLYLTSSLIGILNKENILLIALLNLTWITPAITIFILQRLPDIKNAYYNGSTIPYQLSLLQKYWLEKIGELFLTFHVLPYYIIKNWHKTNNTIKKWTLTLTPCFLLIMILGENVTRNLYPLIFIYIPFLLIEFEQ